QGQLEIRDREIPVDAAQRLAFVDADDNSRVSAGQLAEGVDSPNAVESGSLYGSLLFRIRSLDQWEIGHSRLFEVAAARKLGQYGSATVKQEGGRALAFIDQPGETLDPLQVHRSHDDGVHAPVLPQGRIGRNNSWLIVGAFDQVVAEHEI